MEGQPTKSICPWPGSETYWCQKWEAGEREFLPFYFQLWRWERVSSISHLVAISSPPPKVLPQSPPRLQLSIIFFFASSPHVSKLSYLSFNTSQSEKGSSCQIQAKGGITLYYQLTSVCHEAASLQEPVLQSIRISEQTSSKHTQSTFVLMLILKR